MRGGAVEQLLGDAPYVDARRIKDIALYSQRVASPSSLGSTYKVRSNFETAIGAGSSCATVVSRRDDARVVHHEHDLKQRAAREATLRLQAIDQCLEWQILMRMRAQGAIRPSATSASKCSMSAVRWRITW